MGNEVKPLVKTLRYRVKDRVSGRHLDAAARAVNLVWNHCNGAQRHALKHNTNWPTTGQLQRLTAGAGRLIGVPAQTVQAVCEEYIDRRRGSRKAKLRWRGKHSLGWVPFKNQTVRVRGAIVHFNGRKVRLWLHRQIEGRIKSGFSNGAGEVKRHPVRQSALQQVSTVILLVPLCRDSLVIWAVVATFAPGLASRSLASLRGQRIEGAASMMRSEGKW